MSSIDNQNIFSPVQANRANILSVHENTLKLHASANAFRYDWFVLSDSTASPGLGADSAVNAIGQIDSTVPESSSMESRVERIIQFILPPA